MLGHALPCALALALAGAIVPQSAPADPPLARSTEIAVLRAQLQADAAAAVAWGGYNAGAGAAHELVPAVAAALARVAGWPDSDEQRLCVGSLLDALVRLDARPEPEWIARWWAGHFRVQALVLASRRNQACAPFLLTLLGRPLTELEWQTVANLLLTGDPKGLVAASLAELRLRARIAVVDGFDGCVLGAMSGGSSIVNVPKGFPPTIEYFLTEAGVRADSEPFAPGPTPSHYRRVERRAAGSWFISCSRCSGNGWDREYDRHDYRLRCFAWLLHVAYADLGLEGTKTITHGWQGPAEYRAAVAREVAAIHERWRGLRQALVAAGLTRPEALGDQAPLHVEVEDRREDRTVPLPDLPATHR